MPKLGACLRALVLVAALGAPPAAAGEAVFDFSIAGIRAGELTLVTEEAGGGYSAASRIEAAGILGVLTDFYYDGRAIGDIRADGAVVPARFVADSRSPRAERRTEIAWEKGTPVSVSVEPPRGTAPEPSEQAGTLDPVSAAFAVLRDRAPERLCDTELDVFDGSRRSRLRLGPPQAGAEGIVCAGSYARLEGEAHSLSSQREYPFRLVFRPGGDGLARLQRIETRTTFGMAVVERRG